MKELRIGLNNISAYGLCGAAGFLLGTGYLFFITRVKDGDFDDLFYTYVWVALGAVVGAKVLYVLLALPDIVRIVGSGEADWWPYLGSTVSGGFVFYGGLLGAVCAVKTASRYFSFAYVNTLSLLTPAMPLAHALGRVGCALVGCCYGKETGLCIGISYADSMYAPNGVRLFPVQAMEAIADLVIFGALIYMLLKKADDYERAGIFERYLAMYACARFLLEFFRGDLARGHLGALSTSQWISVIILLSLVIRSGFKRNGWGCCKSR